MVRRQGSGDDRSGSVLVVEDDAALRSLLEDELAEQGLRVRAAASAEEALDRLDGDGNVELVVSDLRLPGADGLELLAHTRALDDPPSFLMITAFGTIDQAVRALRDGADDFLTKPLDLDHLAVRVRRVLENRRLRTQVRRYREALGADDFHGMVGRSEVMRRLFDRLRRVGRGNGPVLVEGESGVGKELAARAIHAESGRRGGPFLAVNCAGVPESLLESEFFGHEKGAFSGAAGARRGLFREASGGTLLLDEVGEMPGPLQATLLRVLQEGKVRAVGSDRPEEIDVRVIAATNRDPEEAIGSGHLRKDLYFRLETFRIRIPPLREREGDLVLLTEWFTRRHAARLQREPPRIGARFLEALGRHPFPGNVRELENVVERAVTFCDGSELEPRHLPDRIREGDATASADGTLARQPDGRGADAASSSHATGSGDPLPGLLEGRGLPTLRELEAVYIRHVLRHTGGNKRRAAALLGVSRGTLYRKLEEEEEEE